MLQENQLEVRILALETLCTKLQEQLTAAERRVAAAEQQTAQAYTAPYLSSAGSVGIPALGPAGGIAARAGSSPGSGTVTLQPLAGGTLTSGSTVTAYNTLATAVGASKNLVVIQDSNGNYLITAGDC